MTFGRGAGRICLRNQRLSTMRLEVESGEKEPKHARQLPARVGLGTDQYFNPTSPRFYPRCTAGLQFSLRHPRPEVVQIGDFSFLGPRSMVYKVLFGVRFAGVLKRSPSTLLPSTLCRGAQLCFGGGAASKIGEDLKSIALMGDIIRLPSLVAHVCLTLGQDAPRQIRAGTHR